MRLSLVFLAAVLAFPVHAEVFRYTDENGNVVYTDEPREDAERIKVKKIPTVTMPDGPLTEDSLSETEARESVDDDSSGYERFFFAEPENNSAFWSGSGNITIAVDAFPALRQDHRYELLLDGEPLGRNSSGIFNIPHVDRGTHTALARIVREDPEDISAKDAVIETESITFTVHRPSVLN